MKCLIFAALIATTYAAAVAPFKWSDCAKDNHNTALTVNSLNISPNPVVFPGDITVDLNLTVNRPINHLFIDVVLEKVTALGNLPIPCVHGTNIGTCQNIDACTILDDILNGTSVVSTDLGKQLETILLAGLGHQPKCPIQPETVLLTHQTLHLQAIPSALGAITNGNYHVKIIVKDDPTNTENVGCLEMYASLGSKSSGLLFG